MGMSFGRKKNTKKQLVVTWSNNPSPVSEFKAFEGSTATHLEFQRIAFSSSCLNLR